MEIAAFTTIWVGLALFALLAGADFGVGFWVLASYLTDRGPELRRDAFGYFAPVWEINFLFLVFFMVGLIAAFPKGLGLLADVLDALILVALILFVFRSASYALLHHGPRPTRGPATLVFAVSSVVAGVALGYTAAAPASGFIRGPDLPAAFYTSFVALASLPLTLAASAHLSAIMISAYGAVRASRQTEWYRWAAMGTGVVVVPCAVLFTVAIIAEVEHTGERLQGPSIIPMVIGGAIVFLGTIALWRRHYAMAALTIFAGYFLGLMGGAFAQLPYLIYPAMTISEAAAPRGSLIAYLVATGAGAPLLLVAMLALYHTTIGPGGRHSAKTDAADAVGAH